MQWLAFSPRVLYIMGSSPRSGQTKDYKIGICCFSAKHTVSRRRSKNWLARNQDNVSEWGDMSIRGLLFQWATTKSNPIQCVGIVQSWHHHHHHHHHYHHHHLIKMSLVLAMILLKICSCGVKQYLSTNQPHDTTITQSL